MIFFPVILYMKMYVVTQGIGGKKFESIREPETGDISVRRRKTCRPSFYNGKKIY